MRPSRAAALIGLLLLAACGGGRREAPAVPAQQAALPRPPVAEPPMDPAERRSRFCRDLASIVDAGPVAFASLRAGAAGERAWEGAVVPPGLAGCRVEGDYHPGASYVCHGGAIAGGSPDLLLDSYRSLAADIDACLLQPIWYPLDWRRGDEFTFAGGERQIVWRDGATNPNAAVALKIEEDLAQKLWYLRLAVGPAL